MASDGMRERTLPAPVADEHAPALPLGKLEISYRLVRRIFAIALALALFVLSLQLMKRGATGLNPIIDALHVQGSVNYIGFGWISAYLLGSGSPVAATALTLFSRGVLS